jgi:hypothetical protein
MYDSTQHAYVRTDILTRINSLSFKAFKQGKGFSLLSLKSTEFENKDENEIKQQNAIINKMLDLPKDWKIHVKQSIYFRDNGVCSGGEIFLTYQTETYVIKLDAPFCQAIIENK